jgi:hypothetical protein
MSRSPYEGGKIRKHFMLSEAASNHLSAIAARADLSRSEVLERLIRSTSQWEGESVFCDKAWKFCIDYCSPISPNETL